MGKKNKGNFINDIDYYKKLFPVNLAIQSFQRFVVFCPFANHTPIKLENNIFDSFVDDCKNTKKPNKYLKEAF